MSTKENTDIIEPFISDVGPEPDLERPSRPLTPKAIVQNVIRAVVKNRRDQSGGDAEGDSTEEGKGSLELLKVASERLVIEQSLREKAEGDVKDLKEKIARLEMLTTSNNAHNIISSADTVGPMSEQNALGHRQMHSYESNAMQQLQLQGTPVNCVATAPTLPLHCIDTRDNNPVTYEEMDRRLDQRLAHITSLVEGMMRSCPGDSRNKDQTYGGGPATLAPNCTVTATEPMSRSRANNLFEALKLLKTLVPYEMDEKYPASWCDDMAASLRSFYPDLKDRDIIELLAKRVPKKHAGINSKALLNCKNLDDFRQELVALGRQQFSTAGFGSATSFINFVPKKIGANANGLRPLVVEILEEAEPLMALPDSQMSDDMRRHFIIEKIQQYLPFAVADKIGQAPIRYGNRSMIEDLAPYLNCPKINKEVDRHLKAMKPPGKANPLPINSVQGPPVANSQADGLHGKARPYKRWTCGRCGSSLHRTSDCAWYPSQTEVACQACIKAIGYNLFHLESECLTTKK